MTRQFLKNLYLWPIYVAYIIVFGLIFYIIFSIYTIETTSETKYVSGIVLEHNVTAYGQYSTIIKTDDGYVEENSSLSIYIVPVGKKVNIKVTRLKQNK